MNKKGTNDMTNFYQGTTTRYQVSNGNYIANEIEAKKRHQSQIDEKGNGKHTKEGSEDRLLGIPYQNNKYTKKDDQQSYYYGYFKHGTRQLNGYIYNQKIKGILTAEDIRQIGYREYHLGIPEEDAYLLMKEYPEYAQGFNRGKKEAEKHEVERNIHR